MGILKAQAKQLETTKNDLSVIQPIITTEQQRLAQIDTQRTKAEAELVIQQRNLADTQSSVIALLAQEKSLKQKFQMQIRSLLNFERKLDSKKSV